MADNRFKNNEFEDLFSNSGNADEFEDIFSSSDGFEDISSNSKESEDDYISDDFTVKYNNAIRNRRRQEIQYDDIGEVFSKMAPETRREQRKREKEHESHPIRNAFIIFLSIVIVLVSCVGFYG